MLLLALLGPLTSPARAQLPPLTVPKGLLRVDFTGRFDNWDRRFLDGTRQDAASDFIRNPADARWLPSLGASEAALRKATGNQTLSLSLGPTTASMLVNVGTAGLGGAYGLTRRLTIFGTVPIVRIRVQNTFGMDSTGATAGFNDSGGAESLFLSQFESALSTLQGRITGGFYDGNPTLKTLAQEALLRGSTLQADLTALLANAAFLPVTGSPAATALGSTIESFRSTMVTTLGIPGFDASPTLPDRGPIGSEFESWATDPEGPIQAQPFRTPVVQYLGDIEFGLAWGWLERAPRPGGIGLRSTLVGTVRIRTGRLDRTDDLWDLPTGDRQPDVQGDLVTDVTGGRFGARITARYVLQLPGRQQRRIATPDQPVAPLALLAAVSRDPGEIIEGSVEPFLRLAPTFALVGGVRYWSKAADTYTYVKNQAPITGASLDDLAIGTKESGMVISGGLSYANPGAGRMPMDAYLRFESVVGSTTGRVPQRQAVAMGIRFYRKVF